MRSRALRDWRSRNAAPTLSVAENTVAATGAVGAATATLSIGITGQRGFGRGGDAPPALTKALTGNAASGATGTAVAAESLGITGNAASTAVRKRRREPGGSARWRCSLDGRRAPQRGFDGACDGHRGGRAVGTLTPVNATTAALTGTAASGIAGAVSASTTVPAAGVQATGTSARAQRLRPWRLLATPTTSVGTVAAVVAYTSAITGNAALRER